MNNNEGKIFNESSVQSPSPQDDDDWLFTNTTDGEAIIWELKNDSSKEGVLRAFEKIVTLVESYRRVDTTVKWLEDHELERTAPGSIYFELSDVTFSIEKGNIAALKGLYTRGYRAENDDLTRAVTNGKYEIAHWLCSVPRQFGWSSPSSPAMRLSLIHI